MRLTTHSTRRAAGTVSLLAALLLVLQALVLVGPAGADEPLPLPDPANNPTEVAGNPECSWYGLTQVTKFDPVNQPTDAVLVQDGVTVTITDHKVEEGTTESLAFDWTSTSWIVAVIVKAGPSANVYSYDPSVKSGSAVTIGTTGISHISFCLGEEPPPPPPVVGEPSGELATSCGTWSADVAVGEGDEQATGSYAFEVREGDTVLDSATLGAGDSDTLGGTFPEDSGDRDIVLVLIDGEGETIIDEGTVETDCEEPEVEVCPPGTDNAGEPVDEVESCDDPEIPVCPPGTDNAGEPLGEVEDCDNPDTGVEPDVVVNPGAAFADPTCEDLDGSEVILDEVDGVTYTVTGDVEPGGTVQVVAAAEDGFTIPASSQREWAHTFANPQNCVQVLPNVVAKPAPAAQELPATGLDSTELLLLAMLLMGLGGTMLIAPRRREQ